jgi:hypothetical protein
VSAAQADILLRIVFLHRKNRRGVALRRVLLRAENGRVCLPRYVTHQPGHRINQIWRDRLGKACVAK